MVDHTQSADGTGGGARAPRRSEYKNFYVNNGGRTYRVAFHVATGKPMICTLRSKLSGGVERLMRLESRNSRKIIAAARVQLADFCEQATPTNPSPDLRRNDGEEG